MKITEEEIKSLLENKQETIARVSHAFNIPVFSNEEVKAMACWIKDDKFHCMYNKNCSIACPFYHGLFVSASDAVGREILLCKNPEEEKDG
jgi:hypothetical protein